MLRPSLDNEDVARFVKDHSGNQYDQGAIVVMQIKGGIMKGTSNIWLEDGQIGYHRQKTNQFLQVAAHPTCLQYP